MSIENKLIGNEYISRQIHQSVDKLLSSQGSIILISGESGFGKTHILNYFGKTLRLKNPSLKVITSECQTPIGNFNVGNLQPLYPFTKAIDNYFVDEGITPEKRFAKSVGLTVLASMPLLGDVFYAVKEIGRDWKQYQEDKNSEKLKKVSTTTADYYRSLLSFALKNPLILLMDDMHWADQQSIELLSLMAETISDLPILIVLTYRKSITELQNLPLNSFIFKAASLDSVHTTETETFTKDQIRDYCGLFFDHYKGNDEFEDWIFEKSLGVAGVAGEYLKYFQKYPPFAPDGSLVTNFKGNEFLPQSVQSVFSQQIESLSEEERNILAVCSCEGREFSAVIVSQLLNVDLLTGIKKLKSLQLKSGIIRSLGAHTRYGSKTTIYKFTQQFYHSYFESSLEFEEYQALHARIANLLKDKYDQTDNDNLKEELAPYLAAHSAESGDNETTKQMLLVSAQFAEKYGNSDILISAYEKFSGISSGSETDQQENIEFLQLLGINKSTNSESGSVGAQSQPESGNLDFSVLDFKMYRKSIENDLITEKYSQAVSKLLKILSNNDFVINKSEKIMLLVLLLKSYTEIYDTMEADRIIKELGDLNQNDIDDQIKSLIYNQTAQYYFKTQNISQAFYWLDKSAALVGSLPHELRLLTLTNIGLISKLNSPQKSKEYLVSAKRLSDSLNFRLLADEIESLI